MIALAFSKLGPKHLILIGFSEKDHINKLRRVFETCRKYNLKLIPEECKFFGTEVGFLGHICTNNGLKPDPKARSGSKVPKTERQRFSSSFCGFCKLL